MIKILIYTAMTDDIFYEVTIFPNIIVDFLIINSYSKILQLTSF